TAATGGTTGASTRRGARRKPPAAGGGGSWQSGIPPSVQPQDENKTADDNAQSALALSFSSRSALAAAPVEEVSAMSSIRPSASSGTSWPSRAVPVPQPDGDVDSVGLVREFVHSPDLAAPVLPALVAEAVLLCFLVC
ncbi:unnamed protein product, partial [Amoebophrya sp. A120]